MRQVSITHPILQIKDKTDCLILTEHPQVPIAYGIFSASEKMFTFYNLT